IACEQLLADRVAVVVREDAIARHALAREEGLVEIRLHHDRVVRVARFRREPEAEHVERQHAKPRGQAIPDRPEVPRRRREAVDREHRFARAVGAIEDRLAAPAERVALRTPRAGIHLILTGAVRAFITVTLSARLWSLPIRTQ